VSEEFKMAGVYRTENQRRAAEGFSQGFTTKLISTHGSCKESTERIRKDWQVLLQGQE
jgi:hypothetical protein